MLGRNWNTSGYGVSTLILPSFEGVLIKRAGRNTNGALLHKYGANAWKVHNYRVEMVSKHVEKAIEEMNERVTELNRSRKNSQVRCTPPTF